MQNKIDTIIGDETKSHRQSWCGGLQHGLFRYRLIRFAVSGGTIAIFSLLLLYILTDIVGVWYIVSTTIVFVIGICTNFLLQKFWAYKESNLKRTPRQFFLFILLGLANILANALFLYFFVEFLHVWYMAGQVFVIAILTATNFLFYGFIFKEGRERVKKPTVLIATGLYPPDIGGPATYSRLLEEELPKQGILVEVLPFGRVRHLPTGIRHMVYAFLLLLKAESVDIIYAQDPISVGLPSWFVSKVLWKKFLLKIVGDYAWEQYQQKFQISNFKFQISLEDFQNGKFDIVTELRRWIERFVARRAIKVIVPSKYLKGIVQTWGVKEEKIEVIYNAFDPPAIDESKEALRQRLRLSGSIIISAGRLVPWKGFDTLISLMGEIAKEIPDAKLYIIGEGPEKERLELGIRNYELGDRVFCLGKVSHSELLKYLKAADLFVLNTGYEGFSHLLLEVMGVGTPIITTNVGGNSELIENKKTGMLVRYNNREELKTNILKFLRTLEYQDMAKSAEERVKEFSKVKMIKNTISILENICAS